MFTRWHLSQVALIECVRRFEKDDRADQKKNLRVKHLLLEDELRDRNPNTID